MQKYLFAIARLLFLCHNQDEQDKEELVMKEPIILSQNCLKEASKEEKTSFILILCTLAAIDGKVKPEEIAYIEELASEMKVEIKPSFFNCSIEKTLTKAAQIKNRRFALELLKYMFALAYTDNVFVDSEGQYICKISEALNIEPQKVNSISSWVIDRIIWLEQAVLIFEETSQP